MKCISCSLALLLCAFCFSCQPAQPEKTPADLVLTNGEVYTMESGQPWAGTIVVTGNKITDVLDKDGDFEIYVGDATRVIDLEGKFVMPGFIDAHTHFDGFAAMQNDADLLAVSDDAGRCGTIEDHPRPDHP